MSEQNPHGVKVGQVWADNDRRSSHRRLHVVEVIETHAKVQAYPGGGRVTTIALTRFKPTSTGYRLVTDTDA